MSYIVKQKDTLTVKVFGGLLGTAVTKDDSATFRLPSDLKSRVKEIAEQTDRSLSNTMLWLLKRGIESYEADAVLVQAPDVTQADTKDVRKGRAFLERAVQRMAEEEGSKDTQKGKRKSGNG